MYGNTTNRFEGKVKWFDTKKGYGFIIPNDGPPDLFVHCSDITGAGERVLNQGDLVSYERMEGRKGPSAINVIVNLRSEAKR